MPTSTRPVSLHQSFPRLPPILSPTASLNSSNTSYDLAVQKDNGRFTPICPRPSVSSSSSSAASSLIASTHHDDPTHSAHHSVEAGPSKKRKRIEANIDVDQRKSPDDALAKLKKVQNSFHCAPLAITSCSKVWEKSGSLLNPCLRTPAARLYEIIRETAARQDDYTYTERISLVYAVHEVEIKASLVPSNGRKFLSRAYSLLAQEWGCTDAEVKQIAKQGRRYLGLMEKCGPAIIFQLYKSASSQ